MNKELRKNIERTLSDALEYGAGEMLRRGELKAGYRMVDPNIDIWFIPDDWLDAIISIDGKKVRIVAIWAKQENNGAFSRLINGIIKVNLCPVVLAPTGIMIAILYFWGWKKIVIGGSFGERQEQWTPTRDWLFDRKLTNNNVE